MRRGNEETQRLDKIIGTKMNELRVSSGLSSQQLATAIGVTHQQIRKYEQGRDRIASSRLHLAAKALKVPTSFFFEGMEDGHQPLPTQHLRMCIELSRNFLRIKNPEHQTAVNKLVATLASE